MAQWRRWKCQGEWEWDNMAFQEGLREQRAGSLLLASDMEEVCTRAL